MIELPAIQIPVLIFFNRQQPFSCNIFSVDSSSGIFRGEIKLSLRRPACESNKNAPIRIQSVHWFKKKKDKSECIFNTRLLMVSNAAGRMMETGYNCIRLCKNQIK